ncbi:hypothetical protein NDU88_007290 [Pleurodeles waltl]|uniref:Uncharacterized protein n=1 Tax=Pleurodeles waltl TaxID=8319 RepID=A0AAV7MMJ3_PLEWA|nr:hypothetical protein NDU88_007288 [Pleurodeles waltl]KAJ1102238.1 hypothetical protein NDU88_007290 [Pleurodeles waltl]
MPWDSTNASQHGYPSVHGQEAAVCHGTVPTPLSTATLLCMDRRALYAMGQYQRPSARLLFCAWTGGRCMPWDSTNAPQHGYSSVHGQEAAVCHGTVPTPLSTATLLCMDRRPLYAMGQYQRLSSGLLFSAWTGGRCMSWDSTNAPQHGSSSVHGQEAARCHGTVPTPLIRATLLCMDRRALYVMGQYQRLSARPTFCAWTGGRCMSWDSTNASQHGRSHAHGQEGRCMSWDSTNASQHGYSSVHGQEVAVCHGTVPTPLSTAPLLRMDRRPLYVMGQYQRLSARLLFCAWTGGTLYVMGQYQRLSARLLFCTWTGGTLYVMGQYQRLSARLLFCAWTGGTLYVMGQYQRPSARLLFCAWTGGRCM